MGIRARLAGVVAGLAIVALGSSGSPASGAAPAPPSIGHVFVIVLENEGFASTFGDPSADPYFAQTLPSKGALLTQYYGIGHASNDNYVAMVSGQGPNPDNQGDCLLYSDFVGTESSALDGQAVGQGCVYPQQVQTIGNQLSENGLGWKGYMGDMGNVPGREAPVCGHPSLDSQDQTQTAVAGDGYAARHDPFVYFHSIIDDTAYCAAHVVPLGTTTGRLPAGTPPGTTGLASDLARTATTPRLSFIVPNLCDDGHDYPCKNQASGASALADIDAFLSSWVPKITGSPAYKKDGLLAIVFDEADTQDASSCCNEAPGPDTPLPGITGVGGGRIGAVLLSPFIRPGTVSATPYNHYSLLASIEGFFGLPRLGYAATTSSTFGRDVFNR
jgi:hypothetical protein